jgi:ElaB/YqjD/DUF883 family membrane-anchored ribosome-binding protein
MIQDRTGDSSNDSDDAIGGTRASGPAAPGSDSEHRGFTVQTGGRNTIAETAERIGRAAGTAHRQMRRGLELVRPGASSGLASPYSYALGGSGGHSNALERDELMAARVMQSIEDEFAEVRHEAANRIGEFRELAAESVQLLRERLHDGVSRSRQLARQLVTEYPLQTVAAVAGFCFVFGAVLCLGGSRRR